MVYIPNTDLERKEMLEVCGVESFEELLARTIPKDLWDKTKFNLPAPLSEPELDILIKDMSRKNLSTSEAISFMGGGVYNHYIPAAIEALISRSEFYTAYTPYQAEVSQGTLQSIFEYQTMVSELLGMDIANASMYDGATASAEAAFLSVAETKRSRILLAKTLHPNYKSVISTYLSGRKIKIEETSSVDGLIDFDNAREAMDNDTAAVFIQQPNFFGLLEDIEPIVKYAKSVGALVVMIVDPITLGVLKSPGEYGADIAVAEGQPFGIPQAFGGPLLGMMAVNKRLVRKIPGRLVGRTIDGGGNEGYCLTLQTREQHIRREKATSNICTNQALCALAATIYLSLLGTKGLMKIGELAVEYSHYAYDKIRELDGFSPKFDGPFFREFVVESLMKPSEIIEKAVRKGIFPGIDLSRFNSGLDNCLLMAFTEKTGFAEVDKLVKTLSEL